MIFPIQIHLYLGVQFPFHMHATSLAWPDRFFPFFFVVAEKSRHKEKRKKAVWPRKTSMPLQIANQDL